MFLCSSDRTWLLFTCSLYCNRILRNSTTNQPWKWWWMNQSTFHGWPNQWFPERGTSRDHKGCLRRNQQVPQQTKTGLWFVCLIKDKVRMWNDLNHGLSKIFTNERVPGTNLSMWVHGWFVVVFGNTSWETLGPRSPTQFGGARTVLLMQRVAILYDKTF